jgi:general secretion pathway protein A
VLVQFGFSPFKMKKAELIATLNTFLIEQYSAGRKVLLIVDEAQNLSLRVLEEIRMLSGVETTKEKVLRIILAGQPELNEKLDAPELVQLAQRVRLRFHLTMLSEQEMQAYIQHRLEVAGADREIFLPDTFAEIFRYTGGVPRLINTLCDTSMMAAFASNRDQVLLEDITNSVEELRWVEFSLRAQLSLRPTTDAFRETHTPATTHFEEPKEPVAHGGSIAKMLVATEGRTVQELPLRTGRIVVGRTADNDLQIDSRFVSRHHCQIVTNAHSSVIEDLNSTNGIYVKSKRVRRHYLNDGDVVVIGKHELIYVDDRQPRRTHNFTDTIPRTSPEESEE